MYTRRLYASSCCCIPYLNGCSGSEGFHPLLVVFLVLCCKLQDSLSPGVFDSDGPLSPGLPVMRHDAPRQKQLQRRSMRAVWLVALQETVANEAVHLGPGEPLLLVEPTSHRTHTKLQRGGGFGWQSGRHHLLLQ